MKSKLSPNITKTIGFIALVFIISCFIIVPSLLAQTWTALPPYNFLWPLWSPALSPVDPVTGLKTPIVSALYPSTVLPFQPGIAWNPIFTNPYFIYNSPVGLQYYDLTYGINPWPPSYSIDTVTGLPIPLNLPVGYQYLPPTDSLWLQENLPIANLAYLNQYPAWALAAFSPNLPPNLTGLAPWLSSLVYPTPSFSSLLTTAQILGYAPVSNISTAPPSTTSIALPPITGVLPTTVLTPPTAVLPTAVAPPPPPLTLTTITTSPGSVFLALTLLGLL